MTDTQAFQWITAEYWRKVIIAYETQLAQTTATATVAAAKAVSKTDVAAIT
jgi:hypothetical protein